MNAPRKALQYFKVDIFSMLHTGHFRKKKIFILQRKGLNSSRIEWDADGRKVQCCCLPLRSSARESIELSDTLEIWDTFYCISFLRSFKLFYHLFFTLDILSGSLFLKHLNIIRKYIVRKQQYTAPMMTHEMHKLLFLILTLYPANGNVSALLLKNGF